MRTESTCSRYHQRGQLDFGACPQNRKCMALKSGWTTVSHLALQKHEGPTSLAENQLTGLWRLMPMIAPMCFIYRQVFHPWGFSVCNSLGHTRMRHFGPYARLNRPAAISLPRPSPVASGSRGLPLAAYCSFK
ncbi:hypothetical protein PAXRUDRAFT_835669 [Paxillus rubicundulus Ve08.2h10]|uniref:Uncharacterized protein n=1 Tax=Paxillus rubicundulus Ve08.2h10 TaxID=930991 RepID=A0A0D0D5U0_9AGAM|nr:hypothetical protein PAXRUDRAFT_835669 [Paxillus rubicundulus Ve08.2h10]